MLCATAFTATKFGLIYLFALWQSWSLGSFFVCINQCNEKQRYTVTPSLIGWVHTQNGPCDHIIITKPCKFCKRYTVYKKRNVYINMNEYIKLKILFQEVSICNLLFLSNQFQYESILDCHAKSSHITIIATITNWMRWALCHSIYRMRQPKPNIL